MVLKSYRELAGLHLSIVLFGLSGVIGKYVALDALVTTGGRTLFAALALGLFMVVTGISFRLRRYWDGLAMLSLGVLLALHWYTFFQSIVLTSVAIGLVTFTAAAIFTSLLEPLVDRRRISGRDLVAGAAVIAGVAMVADLKGADGQLYRGIGMGLLAALTFAVLQIANRKLIRGYSPVQVSFWQTSVAALVLAPVAWPVMPALEGNTLFWLVVLGVLATAVAHTLFIRGMAVVTATMAILLTALEPLYGMVVAAFWLKEIPALTTLIGGCVILAAVIWRQRSMTEA